MRTTASSIRNSAPEPALLREWLSPTRAKKMQAIRQAWDSSNNKVLRGIYALSDGYGMQGYVPVQGYDWSGIRDSSPSAIDAMFDYVKGLK